MIEWCKQDQYALDGNSSNLSGAEKQLLLKEIQNKNRREPLIP